MTRIMADSVTPANLPAGFDVYGCYSDGHYANEAEVRKMYPDKPVLVFTVFASDLIGDYLDVESGDATPQEAPGWVASMRALGHPDPGVYCSQALWTTVQSEFTSQGVIEPQYFIAAYPGPGPVLIPGAIGHQWIDRGPYDESVVADFIPGVDAVPQPPTPAPIGDDMPVSPPIPFSINGVSEQHIFQVFNDVLYWKFTSKGEWQNAILCGPTGTTQSKVNFSITAMASGPAIVGDQLEVTAIDSLNHVLLFALSNKGTWGVLAIP